MADLENKDMGGDPDPFSAGEQAQPWAPEQLGVEVEEPKPVVYQRAGWKHFYRWILFLFVVGLNIAMPMSLIERISKHMVIRPLIEMSYFAVLLFFDVYFLPTCLFEVDSVTVTDDDLTVANLIWKTKLLNKDIVSWQMPKIVAWGILRTSRCFYLINRLDISNFDELAAIIGQKCGAKSL